MFSLFPEWLVLAYLFGLGACVGSFLNVVIVRLPAGESVVRPRSRCPCCKAPIAWYDNIPLLSFMVLRGRCRRCKGTIAPRYFLVELITASLFAALYLQLGPSWELALWLPLCAALLAITFLDLDHWWVPDAITWPFMLLAISAAFLPERLGWQLALLGLLPALLVWLVAWIFARLTGREGLGLGDVKLLALLGLVLGPLGALHVLLLGSLQGVLVGSIVVLTGGHKDARRREPDNAGEAAADDWVPHPRAIPFGPFLALAAFELVLLPGVFAELPFRLTRLLVERFT